jgi:Cu-Zn family superoxide dismutase
VGAALACIALSACSRDASENAAAQRPVPPAKPEVGGDPIAVSRTAITPAARARLRPTDGNSTSGVVEFFERPNGKLGISVELAELAEGKHGLHLHESGDCSAPDASSAGEHFSPDDRPHGSPTDTIHHAGDLGNVTADARGIAVTNLETSDLVLAGRYGVVDRAVIVHSGEDDLVSQPSGNSGDPVACGVVKIVEAPASTG